ncbi:hypothetical protein BH10CYA1_BH10CYA1_29120 [soil metagenome]
MINTNIDLTTCEDEQIHLIGSIQPHGVLLAIDGDDHRICHASTNANTLFGITHQELMGLPIERFLSTEACHHILQVANARTFVLPTSTVMTTTLPAQMVTVHKSDSVVFLELEPLLEPNSEGTACRVIDRLSCLFSTSFCQKLCFD